MNECLVTQLKSSVSDESLPILGAVKIGVKSIESPTQYSQRMVLRGTTNEITAKGLKGIVFGAQWDAVNNAPSVAVADEKTNVTGDIQVYFSNTNGTILIKNKYELTGVTFGLASQGQLSVDLKEFTPCSKLTTFNFGNNTYVGVTGNVEVVKNWPELTSFQVRGGLEGELSAFGKLTKLTTLNIGFNANIVGTIESFAAAQIAAGRTSGTIEVVIAYSGVTYQGLPQNANKYNLTFNNGSYTFTQV